MMIDEAPLRHGEHDFANLSDLITRFTSQILVNLGISNDWINMTNLLLLLAFALLITYTFKKFANYILLFIFKKISQVMSKSLFEYAAKERFPHYVSLFLASSFLMAVIPIIFSNFDAMIVPCAKAVNIYIVYVSIKMVMSMFRSFADVLQEKSSFSKKPFRSYLQVIEIILSIIGLVGVYSIITGNSATTFFAAMGAASAVLMLMFKDSIMGFVASIQISNNDITQVGDWITMTKYGADGIVEEINLTTVKVRNFDNTATTIPTYALISDSFQNWREVQESKLRRFSRALIIKQGSIHFLEDAEIAHFKTIPFLSDFIVKKQAAYEKLNKNLDNLCSHRLSNCDVFMQYMTYYLRNHPSVNSEKTLTVTQLAPTTEGLPIQAVLFVKINQAVYEDTMGELFNHLISTVKYFDLELFEFSSNSDSLDVNLRNKL